MTFQDIAYQVQRETLNLRPAQTSAVDIFADMFRIANRLVDEWALQRFFVYVGIPGAWTIFPAFATQTTDYTFAPGYANLLVMWIAVKSFPSIKIYGKSEAPEIKQLAEQAMEARRALEGVGVQ
jgi:hypothetical protein